MKLVYRYRERELLTIGTVAVLNTIVFFYLLHYSTNVTFTHSAQSSAMSHSVTLTHSAPSSALSHSILHSHSAPSSAISHLLTQHNLCNVPFKASFTNPARLPAMSHSCPVQCAIHARSLPHSPPSNITRRATTQDLKSATPRILAKTSTLQAVVMGWHSEHGYPFFFSSSFLWLLLVILLVSMVAERLRR